MLSLKLVQGILLWLTVFMKSLILIFRLILLISLQFLIVRAAHVNHGTFFLIVVLDVIITFMILFIVIVFLLVLL